MAAFTEVTKAIKASKSVELPVGATIDQIIDKYKDTVIAVLTLSKIIHKKASDAEIDQLIEWFKKQGQPK